MGLRAMAAELNANGHTARHGGPWTDQTVRQLLKRRRHLLDGEVFAARPRFIGWNRKL
jgi:hypothetical protein